MARTIGIDVGGTKVLGVALDARGAVIDEYRVPNGRGADGVQGAIDAVYRELAGRVPDADAVGVGIAGLVDGNGVLRYGPNLPGVIDAPVREALAARTGLRKTGGLSRLINCSRSSRLAIPPPRFGIHRSSFSWWRGSGSTCCSGSDRRAFPALNRPSPGRLISAASSPG